MTLWRGGRAKEEEREKRSAGGMRRCDDDKVVAAEQEQSGKRAGGSRGMWVGRGRQVCGQAGRWHASRSKQVVRHVGRLVGRCASRQAGRQVGGRTGEHLLPPSTTFKAATHLGLGGCMPAALLRVTSLSIHPRESTPASSTRTIHHPPIHPSSTPSPPRTLPLIVITQPSFIIIVWKLIMVEPRPQVTPEYARRWPPHKNAGAACGWLASITRRHYHGGEGLRTSPQHPFLITRPMMLRRRGQGGGGGRLGVEARGGRGWRYRGKED